MITIIIYTTPAISVVITSTSDPIEGQNYSLTCTVMDEESLYSGEVEYMYRWSRNGDSSTATNSSSTLHFTPLTRSDEGTYTCTATIASLLDSNRTTINGRTLIVTRKSVHGIIH